MNLTDILKANCMCRQVQAFKRQTTCFQNQPTLRVKQTTNKKSKCSMTKIQVQNFKNHVSCVLPSCNMKIKNVPGKDVDHFFFLSQLHRKHTILHNYISPLYLLFTWTCGFKENKNQVISQKSKCLQPCQYLCQWILTFLELGNISLFCEFHQIWSKSCTSCL